MLSFVVACPNICENDDTLKTWHILPVPRTSLSMRAKREKKKKKACGMTCTGCRFISNQSSLPLQRLPCRKHWNDPFVSCLLWANTAAGMSVGLYFLLHFICVQSCRRTCRAPPFGDLSKQTFINISLRDVRLLCRSTPFHSTPASSRPLTGTSILIRVLKCLRNWFLRWLLEGLNTFEHKEYAESILNACWQMWVKKAMCARTLSIRKRYPKKKIV